MSTRAWSRGLIVAMMVLAVASGVAQATPLGLNPNPPDLTAYGLDVTLTDLGSGSFSLTASSGSQLDVFTDSSFGFHLAFVDSYALTATFTTAGSLLSGSVSIVGTVPDLGVASSTTLFSGTLSAVGFSPDPPTAPSTFEFVVSGVTGPAQLGWAPVGGVILSVAGLDWEGGSSAGNYSDNFAPAPEPATITLLGLGALGAIGVRLKTRRARATRV